MQTLVLKHRPVLNRLSGKEAVFWSDTFMRKATLLVILQSFGCRNPLLLERDRYTRCSKCETDPFRGSVDMDDDSIGVLHCDCGSTAANRGAHTDRGICSINVVDVFQIVNRAQRSCFGDADSPDSQAFHLEGIVFAGLGECSASPANTDTRPKGACREFDKAVPGKPQIFLALSKGKAAAENEKTDHHQTNSSQSVILHDTLLHFCAFFCEILHSSRLGLLLLPTHQFFRRAEPGLPLRKKTNET